MILIPHKKLCHIFKQVLKNIIYYLKFKFFYGYMTILMKIYQSY